MNGSLSINTGELNTVGNNISEVASQVRAIYTSMRNTIDQVTSNDSWRGEASKSFLDRFDSIRPSFEKHLEELEALGPALSKSSTTYSDAEAENVSSIHQFNDYK